MLTQGLLHQFYQIICGHSPLRAGVGDGGGGGGIGVCVCGGGELR